MIKYDFSYYTERAQVLNEMARPSPLTKLGEHGVIGKQLFDQVGKIMRDGNVEDSEGNVVPGLPLNVHKNRVFRYFLYMLNEHLDDNLDDDSEDLGGNDADGSVRSSDGMINLSKKLLGIPLDAKAKDYGYMNSGALYSAAIQKSIENQPDYVKSPEFKEKVLNTTSIADYMRQGRVATHSSYSVNKAKEQEDKYGAPIEDIHSAQMDIKDILTNIHKAMGYKRRKLTNNSNNQTPTGVVDNDFTENIYNILKTLEELSVFKKVLDRITSSNVDMGTEDNDQSGIFRKALQFNQVLAKPLDESEIASLAVLPRDRTGNTILEDLIEQFSDLKETGIPMEDFKNEIQDIISYTPVEIHPVLNLILKDVTTSEKTTDEYTGYDSDVLKQYITSPEIKEAFDRYYQWYVNNMHDRMEKAKEQLEYSKAGYEEYKGMLPELRRNYAAFLAKWDTINKGKQQAYAKSLRVDDDILSKHGISPEDLGDDYVSSKIKSANYNESYVMNYMTEQVSKDRFKPKGEFKDRGFKKMNYLEWLGKNQ
jgi:hypothetical protein